MIDTTKNCITCNRIECDFNPQNDSAYYIDKTDGEKKLYDGIVIVHEFTNLLGCINHSSTITELDQLRKEIIKGQNKYKEMSETSPDGTKYKLALKALDIVMKKIDELSS